MSRVPRNDYEAGQESRQREIEAQAAEIARLQAELKAAREKGEALLAAAPVLWTCPDCAFSYDARHALPDGTFNCPVCSEARLEAELQASQKARAEALEIHRLAKRRR